MNKYIKGCRGCGNPLLATNRITQKFCSEDCRKSFYRKITLVDKFPKIGTGNLGALSELIASADLLRQGYEVFRAVSPSCSSDLVAIKDGKRLTIEVRTARLSTKGVLYFSRENFRSDHYALVEVVTSTVTYEPPLC
jgi:hypothetical protein